MQKTFFISDTHFGHSNIIKYENRPFANIDEMTKTLITNWNKVIKKEYYVMVLGDFSMYPKDKTTEVMEQLNGRKILILGNHDRHKSTKYWKDVGFEDVSKYPIVFEQDYICSHEPLPESYVPVFTIHGHLHSKLIDNPKYFNVGVECLNYTPIDFEKIKIKLSKGV